MNSSSNINQKEALFLGIISVAAFSLTLPLSKIIISVLEGYQVGLLRSLISGFVAIFILIIFKSKRPNKKQIIQLYSASIGIVYGFPILTALGMETVPVGHGAIVLAVLPLSTAIFGSILMKRSMPIRFWIYSILGLFLVILYVASKYKLEGFYLGDFWLALAVILSGFAYAQSGRLATQLKGWEVICWMLAINFPFVLLASSFLVEPSKVMMLSHSQMSALLFLALINNLAGFFSWNKALALGGIQKISQLQLLQPFLTYAYSVFLMGEAFDWATLLVCGLVILTVIQTQRSR